MVESIIDLVSVAFFLYHTFNEQEKTLLCKINSTQRNCFSTLCLKEDKHILRI